MVILVLVFAAFLVFIAHTPTRCDTAIPLSYLISVDGRVDGGEEIVALNTLAVVLNNIHGFFRRTLVQCDTESQQEYPVITKRTF
jgi:hypothetical protein